MRPKSDGAFAAAAHICGMFHRSVRLVVVAGIVWTGTAPAIEAQASFEVEVAPDSTSASRGGSATYTVAVTPDAGGFAEPVTLSCLGDLAGAICSFDPAIVTPDPSAEMSTLTVSPDVTETPAGPRSFIVAGTSAGGKVAGVEALLVVTDFSLTVNPAAQSVTGGTPATYAVNLNPHPDAGSFDEAISFTCGAGLPAGSMCSFDPVSVTPGSGGAASVLTVSTAAIAVGGDPTKIHAARGLPFTQGLAVGLVVLSGLLFGVTQHRGSDRRIGFSRWRLMVAVGAVLLMGPACGSDEPTDPGPPPVNGTFDVIGTAGDLVRSMTVTITINP